MFRRLSVVCVAAACTLSGLVSANAELTGNPPPAEMPRAACTRRLVDPEGDAKWPAALGQNAQKVDGLDLNGVLLRLTPDQFQLFISAKDLVDPAHMPLTAGAFAYTATFKYGEVLFTFKFMENNSQAPWTMDRTSSTGYPVGGTGVGGAAALPGRTGDAYYDSNYVVFTAPRASMEGVVGGPIREGDQFTAITVLAIQYQDQSPTTIDTLDVPVAEAVAAVGDDYCFGPPPGTLSDLVTPAAVYTDPVTLSAKLVDEAGAAIAGKPVQFGIAGEKAPLSGTTGADGVATVAYAPALGAGTYAVDVRFPGDAAVGKARLAGTIVVQTETSAFTPLLVAKPSATTRTVTATLLDNDKHVVAGQKVDWYVNGKKVATLVTDAKGRSVYKGAKPSQTVLAKYVGLAGKYTAAAAKAVKA
jgi:hypothetical protein